MAGGAETPNIAALPAIARLGTCESARGPDADRHVELWIEFAVEGSLSGAYSHKGNRRDRLDPAFPSARVSTRRRRSGAVAQREPSAPRLAPPNTGGSSLAGSFARRMLTMI